MENNSPLDRDELQMLTEQFSDDALEIAAAARSDEVDRITLYFCTALYFCPGP
jgi:hypothetical protein